MEGPCPSPRARAPQNNPLDVLRKYGWGNGVQLPWADDENREREKLLESKQKRLLALRAEVHDGKDIVNKLKKSWMETTQCIAITQSLVTTKEQDCKSESNLVCQAEKIHDRTLRDKARAEKEFNEYSTRNKTRKSEHEIRAATLEDIMNHLGETTEKLERYRTGTNEKDEAIVLLSKFSAEDEKTLIALEKRRGKLGFRNKELLKGLDKAGTDTYKLHAQLSRLANEFRKVYDQRTEMVQMWSKSIAATKSKDEEMDVISKEYQFVRESTRELDSKLEDQRKILEEKKWNVKEIQIEQDDCDRQIQELSQRVHAAKTMLRDLTSDYATRQAEIGVATTATREVEANIAKHRDIVQGAIKRVERLEAEVQKLRDRLDEALNGRGFTESSLDELEAELHKEEEANFQLLAELDCLRLYYGERSNEGKAINDKLADVNSSESHYKSYLNNLSKIESQNDLQLNRLQSTIYKLDLNFSSMETKISRIENQTLDLNYYTRKDTAEGLKAKEQQMLVHLMSTRREVERAQLCAKMCEKDIDKYKVDQNGLKDKLHEVNLHVTCIERELDLLLPEIRDTQIRHSLENLTLKRHNASLAENYMEKCSLAMSRADFQTTIRERKSEIEFHQCLLRKQRKELRDQLTQLGNNKSEVDGCRRRLKARYELTTRLMAPSDEVDPTEDMYSYQVRKLAREKETLRGEQFKWESHIKEAEREREGLTNMIKLMEAANHALKDTLAPADICSEENQVIECLKDQGKMFTISRRKSRKAKAELDTKLNMLAKDVQEIEGEVSKLCRQHEVKTLEASVVDNEVIKQRNNVERWDRIIRCQIRKIRTELPREFIGSIEQEMKLRMIEFKHEHVVRRIREIAKKFPLSDDLHEKIRSVLAKFTPHKPSNSPVIERPRPRNSKSSSSSNSPVPVPLHRQESMSRLNLRGPARENLFSSSSRSKLSNSSRSDEFIILRDGRGQVTIRAGPGISQVSSRIHDPFLPDTQGKSPCGTQRGNCGKASGKSKSSPLLPSSTPKGLSKAKPGFPLPPLVKKGYGVK